MCRPWSPVGPAGRLYREIPIPALTTGSGQSVAVLSCLWVSEDGLVQQRHFEPSSGEWVWGVARSERIRCDGQVCVVAGVQSVHTCKVSSVLALLCQSWVAMPGNTDAQLFPALLDPMGPVHAHNLGWLPSTVEANNNREHIEDIATDKHKGVGGVQDGGCTGDTCGVCVAESPFLPYVTDVDGAPIIAFDATLHGQWHLGAGGVLVSPSGCLHQPWKTPIGMRVAVPGVGLVCHRVLTRTGLDMACADGAISVDGVVCAGTTIPRTAAITVKQLHEGMSVDDICARSNRSLATVHGHVYAAFSMLPMQQLGPHLIGVVSDNVWLDAERKMQEGVLMGPLQEVYPHNDSADKRAIAKHYGEFRLARVWLLRSAARRRAAAVLERDRPPTPHSN